MAPVFKYLDSLLCPPVLLSILGHHNSISCSITRIRSTSWAATWWSSCNFNWIRSLSAVRPSVSTLGAETRVLPAHLGPCWVWPPPHLLNSSPKPPEAGGVCGASSGSGRLPYLLFSQPGMLFPRVILSPSPGLYINSASGGISASSLPSHLSFFFFSTSVMIQLTILFTSVSC